jgi:hypothetical protein
MGQKCVDITLSVTLGMQLVKANSSRTDVTLFGVRVVVCSCTVALVSNGLVYLEYWVVPIPVLSSEEHWLKVFG